MHHANFATLRLCPVPPPFSFPRYRKCGADEGLEDHREGVHSREKGSRRKDVVEGLDAVSAVTAAAKAVEEELRDQLEAKDEALR